MLRDSMSDSDSNLIPAMISVLHKALNNDPFDICKQHLGCTSIQLNSVIEDDVSKATILLRNAGILDLDFVANVRQKVHWLHRKLLLAFQTDIEIKECQLYKMLQTNPPGSMLIEISG